MRVWYRHEWPPGSAGDGELTPFEFAQRTQPRSLTSSRSFPRSRALLLVLSLPASCLPACLPSSPSICLPITLHTVIHLEHPHALLAHDLSAPRDVDSHPPSLLPPPHPRKLVEKLAKTVETFLANNTLCELSESVRASVLAASEPVDSEQDCGLSEVARR